jgi:hypothetical protein
MSERPCADKGCTEQAGKRGMCELHYRRWFRANIAQTCSVDVYGNPVIARGWCAGHYNRWRNTGEPGTAEWHNDGSKARARCLDCDRPVGPKGGSGRCPRCRKQLMDAAIVAQQYHAASRLHKTRDRSRDTDVRDAQDPAVEDRQRGPTDHQFDEIIVATLPRRVSRWLEADLPREAERRFGIPVTIILMKV